MSCKSPGVKHECSCGVHNPVYDEDNLGKVSIRTFNDDSSAMGFVEEGDRWIEAIHENDWKIILDGEGPQSLELNKIIQIPKGMPYTIIKGTSPFSLKVTKSLK